MIIKIDPLFSPEGKQKELTFRISENINLQKEGLDISARTPLTGTARVFRTEDDAVVILKNTSICVDSRCSRCAESIDIMLDISNSEQIFYSKKTDILGEEDFCINRKDMSIDLAPFFLQEIISHIPQKVVHQKSKCDPNMLKKIEKMSSAQKPFPLANIKNIFEQQKKKK